MTLRAGSPTAIVGNGPSVLGSRLGSTIDSFEAVVRCNDWVTENYEIDLGSKTTHWFTGINRDSRVLGRKNISGMTIVRCYPDYIYKISSYEGRRREAEKRLQIELGEDYEVPCSAASFMSEKTGLNHRSCGFSAIAFAVLVRRCDVHVAGFDFYQDPEARDHYYSEARKVRVHPHAFDQERAIVEGWIKEGRVRRLTRQDDAGATP